MSEIRAAIARHTHDCSSFAALCKSEPPLDSSALVHERYAALQVAATDQLFDAAWAVAHAHPNDIGDVQLLIQHAARVDELSVPDEWLKAIVKNLASVELDQLAPDSLRERG